MDDGIYGFYTVVGEHFARRHLSCVGEDIRQDRLTRRKALDKVAEILERVATMDGASVQQESLDLVAGKLNLAFVSAGIMPLTGNDLGKHCAEWSRKGSSSNPLDTASSAVLSMGAAADALSRAILSVSKSGLSVCHRDLPPWKQGFCLDDGKAPAEVVLYTWDGEVAGDTYVGAIVFGDEGASYLEHVVQGGDVMGALKGILGAQRVDPVIRPASVAVTSLASSMVAYNLLVSASAEPGRLSTLFRTDAMSIQVIATWDGEPISVQSGDRNRPGAVSVALKPVCFSPTPEQVHAEAPTVSLMR